MCCGQGEHTNVELASVDQQWLHQVLLEDEVRVPMRWFSCLGHDVLLYLVEIFQNPNSIAPVRGLSWLVQPELSVSLESITEMADKVPVCRLALEMRTERDEVSFGDYLMQVFADLIIIPTQIDKKV